MLVGLGSGTALVYAYVVRFLAITVAAARRGWARVAALAGRRRPVLGRGPGARSPGSICR